MSSSFPQIWEVWGLYLFNYFFCSFLFLLFCNSHYVYVCSLDGVQHISENLFNFLYSFCILFLRLDNVNSQGYNALLLWCQSDRVATPSVFECGRMFCWVVYLATPCFVDVFSRNSFFLQSYPQSLLI